MRDRLFELVVLIGLLLVGSVDRWRRNLGWIEERAPFDGLVALAGSLGLLALALAVAFATPLVERFVERSVDWTQQAAVRGNAQVLVIAGALVVARAAAMELVLRRWIVDRGIGLGASPYVMVLVAAGVELVISGGHLGARIGAAIAGLGFGLLYLGAGRRLAAPLAARIVFELGALVLVWARWI